MSMGSRLFQLLGPLLLLLTVFAPRPVTAAASAGTPSMMPRERSSSEDHRQLPAAGSSSSYEWLLNRKPRGKPPPSAPSKRTN
ncbi:hypothetical protein PAHAL_3G007000 [Panicum hallii]|uniref:Uncharacterized protein n=1 Tax=Panicum hallii TaxID=206008 RepID=A0A2T8KGL0_9POAL|nr:hypothetical protein PAHAL_3G007000 [Panicum hallii]